MASSLFNNQQIAFGNNNSIFSRLNAAQGLMNGNPQVTFNNLLRTNPQFAEFVQNNQGKSVEQIAQENSLDLNMIKTFMGQ